MSLAIEVHRIPVRLHRFHGEEIDAILFVHLVGADAHDQSALARLNESDSEFVPFEIEGRVHLVRISSLVAVELVEEPAEVAMLDQVGAVRTPVDLVLRTGRHLRGDLIYEDAEGRRRILDLLNKDHDRFVLLAADDHYYLVQREAIDQLCDL